MTTIKNVTMQTNVMQSAWTIAKAAQSRFGGKVREYFTQALKLAWTYEKKAQAEFIQAAPAPAPAQVKAVSVPRGTMPKKVATDKVAIKKPKKAQADKLPKKVKKASKIKEEETAPFLQFDGLPSCIIESFNDNVCATVSEMIRRYIEHANKLPNAYRLVRYHNFTKGMEALENVSSNLDLQGVMCAFFLRDYITKLAKKTIMLGVGYKNKNKNMSAEQLVAFYAKQEQRYSYQNAPSSAGNITQYDFDDIAQEVIMMSYTKVLSDSMFEHPDFVMRTLFYRVSNAVQKMMNQLRRETSVKTKNSIYIQQERSTIDDALRLVDHYGIWNEEEEKVLKLAIMDFQKKEIDKIMGKRTDRTFKRIEKQLVNM